MDREDIAIKEGGLLMTKEQRDRLLSTAMVQVDEYLDGLATSAAVDVEGSEKAADSLRMGKAPEHGVPLDDALATIFSSEALKGFNTAGPSYLAHVPGGGMFVSAVGGLISNCLNRFTGVWEAAPGLVQLEVNVIRWMCSMVGYPASSMGTLTSGGSMANFGGVFTAKEELLEEEELFAAAIYVSEQINHSVCKATRLAGFPASSVRAIATDNHCRMSLDALREAIAADKEGRSGKKMRPFLIIASGGTTNTGAVDDLGALADLAEKEGMWLHVDACYGGFFALTSRGKETLSGLERAHSIALDPHKSLFVPFGTGALIARDGEALKRAHFLGAEYMPDDTLQGPDQVDFAQLSAELSRDYRGLRVWLPIMLHGMDKFRQELDTKLDLARWVVERLREIAGIEVPIAPQLSIVVFRHCEAVEDDSEEQLNTLNRRLLAQVNGKGHVYLSGASILGGGFYVRMCILNFRTDSALLQQVIIDIREAVSELQAASTQQTAAGQ